MLRRILLRIGDFLFVLRPVILVPVWSFYLLGSRAGERLSPSPVPSDGAYAGLLSLTAVMITAYLINQIFDQESDRRNNKGYYLPLGIFRPRTVLIMAMVFFAAASAAFRESAAGQRAPLVVALVLSLTYSLPPLRLCARPFLDLAANAVGYGGVAFVVGFAPWAFGTGVAMETAPWVLLVGATFLHTTILDLEGDRATGKITSSVLLGERHSALLAAVMSAAALGWSLWRHGLDDPVATAVLAVCAVVFAYAYALAARGGNMSSRAIQLATLAVTAAAAAYQPLYLALLIPLVLAARVYYRARFGIAYPG